MESNLKCWLWLSSLVKISPRKRLALLNYFRDPVFLWEAGESELRASQLCTPKIISYIMDNDIRRDADKLTERIRASDISVITIHDASYPQMLKYTADPPAVLYCRGRLMSDEHCVAVVGSRKATWYGLDMSKRLSSELARHGVTVVSGMARGVDSKAHCGALEAGGRTIAVLGCGVDIVYPSENRGLMEEICKQGAVISEFLPGTEPIPFNFPARNRIISGLSRGVVIVEASEKSGSLITADYALEQGRDVFAVPGNINSMNSSGTNRLIREGARIITCAGDILDEINIKHEDSLKFYGEKKHRDMRSVLSPLLNDEAGGQVKMDLNACDAVGKPTADAGGKPVTDAVGKPVTDAVGKRSFAAGANGGVPNDEPNGGPDAGPNAGPDAGSNKKACSAKLGESAALQIGVDEKTIAEKLLNGPAHIDVIARDCGISVQLAGSVLLMLELSGFVEQLPGKFYRLVD
ncbi:MAG TPA: DNA-processing protein DprA [Clostridia bacterium]|nr:DNA-processing protein DprA [Clostridia bacterium]